MTSPVFRDRDDYWFVGRLGWDPVVEPELVNNSDDGVLPPIPQAAEGGTDFTFVNSVAYEILDSSCPKTRSNGTSVVILLSPVGIRRRRSSNLLKDALTMWPRLRSNLKECVDLGMVPHYQIGEPWWWDGSKEQRYRETALAPMMHGPWHSW